MNAMIWIITTAVIAASIVGILLVAIWEDVVTTSMPITYVMFALIAMGLLSFAVLIYTAGLTMFGVI